MNWEILVALFLVLWAGADGTPETEIASDIVTAVVTRSVAHTVVPTSTQTPTATLIPTASPTKTTASTATPTWTLTPTPISTPEMLESYESPDGKWITTLERAIFLKD